MCGFRSGQSFEQGHSYTHPVFFCHSNCLHQSFQITLIKFFQDCCMRTIFSIAIPVCFHSIHLRCNKSFGMCSNYSGNWSFHEKNLRRCTIFTLLTLHVFLLDSLVSENTSLPTLIPRNAFIFLSNKNFSSYSLNHFFDLSKHPAALTYKLLLSHVMFLLQNQFLKDRMIS